MKTQPTTRVYRHLKTSVIGILGLAVLCASPALSVALPKGQTGAKCLCVCKWGVPGAGGYSDLISNETVYGCQANIGKTCNVQDPQTGGIRSGTIFTCEQMQPGAAGTQQGLSLHRQGAPGGTLQR